MTGTRKIRVVLADDHRLVREGLAALLSRTDDCEVVAEAGDGEAVLALVGAYRPDVVVLDHSMPVMTGLEVVKVLSKEKSGARCVVLSSFNDSLLVAEMLRSGASGFLVKEDSFDEVVSAIRSVAAEGVYFSKSLDEASLCDAFHMLSVTGREAEVLAGLVKGKSAKEIAASLGIGARTVETYRNQLVAKFGARNATDLAVRAVRAGFCESGR